MQYQIITFGNGEILKGVLDAIAMCLNSQTGTLYAPLLRIGMIFGVLWAAIYSIWGDFLKAWGRATLPFIFIPPLLFIPSTPVYIHDVVSNYRDKVDNVPYGLAYVAHFVSQIGYEVTKQVDQVFANVDDLKYHKSGFLMASNLIQQARSFQITNEDVASTLREFVCQCVAYEAMLGHKYTFEDLRHSSDIWGLVSARPSAIRSFIWKHPHKPDEATQPPEIVSCREGVKRFNRIWRGELDKAKTIFGIKLFGHTNPLTARTEFLKYLPASYGFLSGLSQSADQILKQQMMVHAVVDGIEQKSTSLGNAPNFAARRAYLQQRSTYETLGVMASESLMTMKAVLEGIVYAAFIFLVPLAMLPFGVKILLSWLQTLLWLQMWAPLYAVLNFMVSMGARAKSMGMLSTSNPEGVTIASSAGLMNLNADISAMAGYLAMSVPFIAIALVKGVGSFVHMASHLGNVSQGAAAQSATDAVSGNYSFGNVSEGNHQIANSNMLSQSRAASYRSAAFRLIEGREDITTMADGSQIANIGVSNLPVSVNAAETQSAQISEAAAQTYQKALNQSASSAASLASSYRQMVDFSNNLAKSESMSDGASTGINSEQAQAVHASKQMIQDFADNHNISIDKAANLFMEASMGGGMFLKGAIGGKASINASDQEMLQEAKKYMEDHHFQEAARKSSQASKSLSHTLMDESSKRLAEGVSGSYEKGMQQRQEAAKSYNESQALTQQAINMRANSAAINANYNQQFFEWLSRQKSDNTAGHIGSKGAADIVANKPQEAMAWGNKYMAGLLRHETLPNPQAIKTAYDKETGHQVYMPTTEPLHAARHQLPPEFDHPLGKEGSVSGGRIQEGSRDNAIVYLNDTDSSHSHGSSASMSGHLSQGEGYKSAAFPAFYEAGKRPSKVESLPLPEFNRPHEGEGIVAGRQGQEMAHGIERIDNIPYESDRNALQTPGISPSDSHPLSQGGNFMPEEKPVLPEPGNKQSNIDPLTRVESLPLLEFNLPKEGNVAVANEQGKDVAPGIVGDSDVLYGNGRNIPQIPDFSPSADAPSYPSLGEDPKTKDNRISVELGKRQPMVGNLSKIKSLPLPEFNNPQKGEITVHDDPAQEAAHKVNSDSATQNVRNMGMPQIPESSAPAYSFRKDQGISEIIPVSQVEDQKQIPLESHALESKTSDLDGQRMPDVPAITSVKEQVASQIDNEPHNSGAAFKDHLSVRGDTLREEAANVIEDSNRMVEATSTLLNQNATDIQKKVKGQQGKPVINKATKKLGEELHDTIFGEPQQK